MFQYNALKTDVLSPLLDAQQAFDKAEVADIFSN